jgi:hypothetical protein
MNAFCSLKRRDHSVLRKRMSKAYSKTSIVSSPQLKSLTQQILLSDMLQKINCNSSNLMPVEIVEFSHALSLDLVTSFIFGRSSGSNFTQDAEASQLWLQHYEHRYCRQAFWNQELPKFTHCLNALGISMLPRGFKKSTEYLEDWLMDMCKKSDDILSAADKRSLENVSDTPLVYQLVKAAVYSALGDVDPASKDLVVASELFDHVCMLSTCPNHVG